MNSRFEVGNHPRLQWNPWWFVLAHQHSSQIGWGREDTNSTNDIICKAMRCAETTIHVSWRHINLKTRSLGTLRAQSWLISKCLGTMLKSFRMSLWWHREWLCYPLLKTKETSEIDHIISIQDLSSLTLWYAPPRTRWCFL